MGQVLPRLLPFSVLSSHQIISSPTLSWPRRKYFPLHTYLWALQEMVAAYAFLSNGKLLAEYERRKGLFGSGGTHSGGQQAMDTRWALHRLLRSTFGLGEVKVQVGLG